jgi:energy-coupling factor transport system ATP-binding protein
MVFQRPQDQVVATTVEEDAAFGPSNLGLPHAQVRDQVEQALAAAGLTMMRERSPFSLSAGEAQRLALAGVLAMQPRCLIFDETTAMLDPSGRSMVMTKAKALNSEGSTVLLITHLMEEAAAADRVLVLHQGRLVMEGSPSAVFSNNTDLEAFSLGQPRAAATATRLRRFFPSLPENILLPDQLLHSLPDYSGHVQKVVERSDGRTPGNPLIDIRGLSHTYLQESPLAHQALFNLSIKVHPRTIHGLIGSTGSGKSTLLQHLNALLLPQTGSIHVAGFDLNASDLDILALRRSVAMAFQQPEDQIFKQYIGDEIAYGPRQLGYEGKLADIVKEAMEAVGLDFASDKDRLTATLSGGERRKVALASALAIRSEVLLLDEPLAGLDPQSVQELVLQLKRIHASGVTLLISTHQYDELTEVFDQASVLSRGRDIIHGSCGQVFSDIAGLEKAGLEAPLGACTAEALREKGWPLSEHIAALSDLENELEILLEGRPYEPA